MKLDLTLIGSDCLRGIARDLLARHVFKFQPDHIRFTIHSQLKRFTWVVLRENDYSNIFDTETLNCLKSVAYNLQMPKSLPQDVSEIVNNLYNSIDY